MTLLIIGFDGATFDLIKPCARDGYLSNLAGLMRDGVIADLASTLPPVTSPAWPTFMTGVNPGKHGVFDFIQPHGDNFTLVEPVHGSAPDIAGMGVANPCATILAAAQLLDALGEASAAAQVQAAVERTLGAGIWSADLGGTANTEEMTAAIIERLGD